MRYHRVFTQVGDDYEVDVENGVITGDGYLAMVSETGTLNISSSGGNLVIQSTAGDVQIAGGASGEVSFHTDARAKADLYVDNDATVTNDLTINGDLTTNEFNYTDGYITMDDDIGVSASNLTIGANGVNIIVNNSNISISDETIKQTVPDKDLLLLGGSSGRVRIQSGLNIDGASSSSQIAIAVNPNEIATSSGDLTLKAGGGSDDVVFGSSIDTGVHSITTSSVLVDDKFSYTHGSETVVWWTSPAKYMYNTGATAPTSDVVNCSLKLARDSDVCIPLNVPGVGTLTQVRIYCYTDLTSATTTDMGDSYIKYKDTGDDPRVAGTNTSNFAVSRSADGLHTITHTFSSSLANDRIFYWVFKGSNQGNIVNMWVTGIECDVTQSVMPYAIRG